MKLSIQTQVTEQDIIDISYLFKKLPETNLTKGTILARCLVVEYATWLFKEDNNVIGFVCFNFNEHPIAFVTGIVLEGKSKEFYDLFYDKLKEFRFTYLKAASNLSKERFEGFSGFKQLYSIYGKEL